MAPANTKAARGGDFSKGMKKVCPMTALTKIGLYEAAVKDTAAPATHRRKPAGGKKRARPKTAAPAGVKKKRKL